MKARWGAIALALAASVAASPSAWAVSPLAFELLARGQSPELILAQRVIDREWTTRQDSGFIAHRVPGSRSEGAALTLSAIFPGGGQLYAGERSGYLFALAEAAGWARRYFLMRDSDRSHDDAAAVAGAPEQPASAWSFERWETATQQDREELEALYRADRNAFFDAIASDSRYAAGWSDPDSRKRFADLLERHDAQLRRAHRTELLLWLNHLVAAADAFRAARIHNLPLRRSIELKADGGWRGGQPALMVVISRTF